MNGPAEATLSVDPSHLRDWSHRRARAKARQQRLVAVGGTGNLSGANLHLRASVSVAPADALLPRRMVLTACITELAGSSSCGQCVVQLGHLPAELVPDSRPLILLETRTLKLPVRMGTGQFSCSPGIW